MADDSNKLPVPLKVVTETRRPELYRPGFKVTHEVTEGDDPDFDLFEGQPVSWNDYTPKPIRLTPEEQKAYAEGIPDEIQCIMVQLTKDFHSAQSAALTLLENQNDQNADILHQKESTVVATAQTLKARALRYAEKRERDFGKPHEALRAVIDRATSIIEEFS